MPLPEDATIVNGGCNCGAVRYRVAVPQLAGQPLHPLSPAGARVLLPFLALDYCNDCRRVTGSFTTCLAMRAHQHLIHVADFCQPGYSCT